MQKLDSLTRIITDSMNEMASGAVQINNAVQEVSEITQKNQQPRRKRRGIKPSYNKVIELSCIIWVK